MCDVLLRLSRQIMFRSHIEIDRTRKNLNLVIMLSKNLAIMLILFVGVVILPLAFASAEVAPRDPELLTESKIENNKQIVDEPAIKETQLSEPKVKSAISSISEYYGVSGKFVHGFIATLSVIIVSELGDKTFFIAAIMAMRHSRITILSAAIGALAIMHVMSALFGALALNIIPKAYTYYISAILFTIFGLKMLKEGYYMSPEDAQEEMEEVQEELRKKEDEKKMNNDVEGGLLGSPIKTATTGVTSIMKMLFSPIFLQAFTMTFLAEWGDRSQLATIVLAAKEDTWAVIIAGIIGHSLCTALAVMGGRYIAQKISVRTVTLVGAVVFLVFAFTAFLMDPDDDGALDPSLVS